MGLSKVTRSRPSSERDTSRVPSGWWNRSLGSSTIGKCGATSRTAATRSAIGSPSAHFIFMPRNPKSNPVCARAAVSSGVPRPIQKSTGTRSIFLPPSRWWTGTPRCLPSRSNHAISYAS